MNQYASTVGGGAMTMVVRKARGETAKPAKEEKAEIVRPAEAAVIIRRAPAQRRKAA